MGKHGWIGVDLDGTLAFYDTWRGVDHIGAPIMPMVRRVRQWLAEGKEVRIFTARVGEQNAGELELVIAHIEAWCLKHIGRVLAITNIKDFAMIECWDDRAIQVVFNTGHRADGIE